MARSIAVLTTGRQDWGLLHPVCARLRDDSQMELILLVGGMALDAAFGDVSRRIADAGYSISESLNWETRSASPWKQCADATSAVGAALTKHRPHGLLILGDRFETAAAALAATVARVPIAHLYGGEETVGAFDNSLRHAITKMSHLHLVAHQDYADRVLQMGEDPTSVHIVGSLGVENTLRLQELSRTEICRQLSIPSETRIGLVTVHPTTLGNQSFDDVLDAVCSAVESISISWIITLPNADPGNATIRHRFQELASRHQNIRAFEALGERLYIGVMRHSHLVLGNSSSGMIEAPALGVPTVNVGSRQQGRIRFPSIVDVPPSPAAVTKAVAEVLSGNRRSAENAAGPVGDVNVSRTIHGILRAWTPDTKKAFLMTNAGDSPPNRQNPTGDAT